jgi:hypothetical protein
MRQLTAIAFPVLLGLSAACGSSSGEPTGESSAAIGGSSLPAVRMGVDANGESSFQAATALKAEVVRVYLPQGARIPTSTKAAKLDAYYAAGQAVVYSIKPDTSPDDEATNKLNLAALAKDIESQGYKARTWIALHHEPYPELSGSAFQAMYATYAPSVRNADVPCGVIYQAYPLYHGQPNYADDYTSDILPLVDFLGIDVYPGGMPSEYTGNVLADISPFTTYAKDHGKPFQIDEIAVDSSVPGTKEEQATWLSGLLDLGSKAQLVMYYQGTPSTFPNLHIDDNPDAVAEWKDIFNTLTTR